MQMKRKAANDVVFSLKHLKTWVSFHDCCRLALESNVLRLKAANVVRPLHVLIKQVFPIFIAQNLTHDEMFGWTFGLVWMKSMSNPFPGLHLQEHIHFP